MAYNRTTWENREVEKPRTFTMANNPDGTITLTPAEGTIVNAGTPIIAENMNKIEEQLVVTDEHMNNISNPHNVIASQVGAYSTAEADANFVSSFERYGILMYAETNRSYTGGGAAGASTIYLPYQTNVSGGIINLDGNGVEVPRTGTVLVTTHLSFTDITTTTAPYIVVNIVAGNRRYRVGGAHYTSNGNFSVGGSVIAPINATETIYVEAASGEDYTVIGIAGETRSFLSVRELL